MNSDLPVIDHLPTTRLFHFWESIRTSLWFLPSLLVLSAVILAYATIGLDHWLPLHSEWFRRAFSRAGPEGARSVLSTIAGSVITVTGVTFSITIVALTLASSQFGPRLLRNFMKDKGNQFVLGTFIATFIYCLIVLQSIHTDGETDFVPNLSLTIAVLLIIADVFVLIYFIHHISASIQADYVIKDVYVELESTFTVLFPRRSYVGANLVFARCLKLMTLGWWTSSFICIKTSSSLGICRAFRGVDFQVGPVPVHLAGNLIVADRFLHFPFFPRERIKHPGGKVAQIGGVFAYRFQHGEHTLLKVPHLLVIADEGMGGSCLHLQHIVAKETARIPPVEKTEEGRGIIHLTGQSFYVAGTDLPAGGIDNQRDMILHDRQFRLAGG